MGTCYILPNTSVLSLGRWNNTTRRTYLELTASQQRLVDSNILLQCHPFAKMTGVLNLIRLDVCLVGGLRAFQWAFYESQVVYP